MHIMDASRVLHVFEALVVQILRNTEPQQLNHFECSVFYLNLIHHGILNKDFLTQFTKLLSLYLILSDGLPHSV